MIRSARQEFDQLLDSLHQQVHTGATAFEVERDLFKQLLALGRSLLALFFTLVAQHSSKHAPERADATDRPLPRHSYKRRRYVSFFGEVLIERPYFWAPGGPGRLPLDEQLSLPPGVYSDFLREHAELLCAHLAYGQTATVLERLLGFRLSTRSLSQMVEDDAQDAVAFYAQQAASEATAEAAAEAADGEILVIQADGKGVPMRPLTREEATAKQPVRLRRGQSRTKKKEAVVTSLYWLTPRVRSAEEVVASFFKQPAARDESGPADPATDDPDHRPQQKKLWATLEGKDVALARLAQQVRGRDGDHLTCPVALADGCPALQARLREQFPRFELILDFVHVSEYLWKAANALFHEADPQREAWVIARTRELLSGQHAWVVSQLYQVSQRPDDALAKVARYFEHNAAGMDYRRYLARGWPIASGVIEGACRHLVKDRCEASGMRWHRAGAEQVLALRAIDLNGDWEAYHTYRRAQRHLRLYGCSLEQVETPEEQTLRWAA
ncbi:MAG TPA: ISKra4 family transposase [Acidobacteriota bacterium]|nr:ISKra4 family transposase [Acidobacteriota bacterium]